MNFFESLPSSTRQLILLWGPGALQLLGKLVFALTIFLVGRWLSGRLQRVSKTLLARAGVDAALCDFFGSLVRYATLAATIIAALEKLDVKTASLLAVFASAGLAVGLALQGSLSNFAAGTMILFFRPFTKGDRIEVAGKQGLVEEIGIFTTRLVSTENETIILPNSTITGGVITNYSARGDRRGTVLVDVKETEDLDALVAMLEGAVQQCRQRSADFPPQVYLQDQGKVAVRIAMPADRYETAMAELRKVIFDAVRDFRKTK